jgi:hypothetical protein
LGTHKHLKSPDNIFQTGAKTAVVKSYPVSKVVIARVVTPEGLPLSYEVLPGDKADCKTPQIFLDKIETQHGRARRVWVMDRGIPTEAVLAEMRASDPPMQYLVGTPKGRLSRLEKQLVDKRWQQVRPGIDVKLLPPDGELYVFAASADRVTKERAMRRRQLKWLWKRLRELAAIELSREEMLMKLGALRAQAPTAWRLIDIEVDAKSLAPGLTARGILEKFTAVQMIDVHLPTTDGRQLVVTRYTQPEPELQLLLAQLKLQLPPQPPPRITTTTAINHGPQM